MIKMNASKLDFTYTPLEEEKLRSAIASQYGRNPLFNGIRKACAAAGYYPTAEARLDVALVHAEEMVMLRLFEDEALTGENLNEVDIRTYIRDILGNIEDKVVAKIAAVKANSNGYRAVLMGITQDMIDWKRAHGKKSKHESQE